MALKITVIVPDEQVPADSSTWSEYPGVGDDVDVWPIDEQGDHDIFRFGLRGRIESIEEAK